MDLPSPFSPSPSPPPLTLTFWDYGQSRREDEEEKDRAPSRIGAIVALVIIILWVGLGLAAYVSAFQCTHEKYGGGEARKVAMLLLAALLGPFYWIFQPSIKKGGYCQLKNK